MGFSSSGMPVSHDASLHLGRFISWSEAHTTILIEMVAGSNLALQVQLNSGLNCWLRNKHRGIVPSARRNEELDLGKLRVGHCSEGLTNR
jgi:hypothetical protein